MQKRKFYGKGIPGVDLKSLQGKLIVIEGAESAGCTTQVSFLKDHLERLGHPTAQFGVGQSEFMGAELQESLKSNILCPITSSLMSASEIADQIENKLIPALRAGFIVIADRYIYSAMVQTKVYGADYNWIRSVFGIALVPDIICYLDVNPEQQIQRVFAKKGVLTYSESGGWSLKGTNLYEMFLQYQQRVHKAFRAIAKDFRFELVNGNQTPHAVHDAIFGKISKLLPQRTAKKIGIKK